MLPKGFVKSLELFNLHRASVVGRNRPFVVVEGFFGCMKVWQAGHRRVVSIMGSRLSTSQEELIVRTAGQSGHVVLLFDEDQAGRKGREDTFQRLNPHLKVRIASFDAEVYCVFSVYHRHLREPAVSEPRIIKKYPNRRLYDTTVSSYITLEDVRQFALFQLLRNLTFRWQRKGPRRLSRFWLGRRRGIAVGTKQTAKYGSEP